MTLPEFIKSSICFLVGHKSEHRFGLPDKCSRCKRVLSE